MRTDLIVALQAALDSAPTRDQIRNAQQLLMAAEGAGHGVEILHWHHYADGQVARTVLIEAGNYLSGAAHLTEHLCICAGDITVWTEGGHTRLTGYHVLTSLPGAERIGYAHSDTWFTTIHVNPDNCTDARELERRLIEHPERLQCNRFALESAPAMEAVQWHG